MKHNLRAGTRRWDEAMLPFLLSSRFRIWGLGFRVWGLGFRVWGLGFLVVETFYVLGVGGY